MATPIIVNPNRPSQVVVNPTNQSQVSVRPTAPTNVIVNGSQKSGAPIIIDDSIDWARIEVMIENAIANSGGGGGNNDGILELAEFVTYNELVAMRANSELIPAKWYVITDYVTKVNDPNGEFISAEHPFAVLVQASLPNELSELARAARTYEDYFENSLLTSWELKYCLDNDRYPWGDTENGKGIIYYMKDEWGNECPYDFKNIMFKRYYEENTGSYIGVYDSNNTDKHPALPNYNIDLNDYIYLYTFTIVFDGELYDSSLGIGFAPITAITGESILSLCQNNKVGISNDGSLAGNRLEGIIKLDTAIGCDLPNSVIATVISSDDYPYDSEDPLEAALSLMVILILLIQLDNVINGSYNTVVIPPLCTKVSGGYNFVCGGFGDSVQSCNCCAVISMVGGLAGIAVNNTLYNCQDVYVSGIGNTIEAFCNDCEIVGNYNTIEKNCTNIRLYGTNVNVRVLQGTSDFHEGDSLTNCYIGENSKGEIKVWNPADLVTI